MALKEVKYVVVKNGRGVTPDREILFDTEEEAKRYTEDQNSATGDGIQYAHYQYRGLRITEPKTEHDTKLCYVELSATQEPGAYEILLSWNNNRRQVALFKTLSPKDVRAGLLQLRRLLSIDIRSGEL